MTGTLKAGRLPNTWYLRVELPRKASGERDRRRETFRGTKKEAEKRLRELLREVETGRVSSERLTIAEIAHAWLEAAEHRVAHRTYVRYEQLVEDFIVPELGSLRAEAIRPTHVDAAVDAWRKRKNSRSSDPRLLSAHSVRHAFDAFRAICRWAVRKGTLPTNPCERADAPEWKVREMRALDAAGLAALLAAARGTELEIPIVVFVGTGLRRGEAFGLRWTDIDLDRARLTVKRSIEVVAGKRREKAPKTAKSLRTIALPPFVVDALRRQHAEQSARRLLLGLGKKDDCYVFDRLDGSPWSPDQFGWRFADLVRRSPDVPKVRLHDLRHSYATFMLSAGVDLKSISTALGHSTIAVTANTYAHVSAALHEDNAARLDVAIGGVVNASMSAGPRRAHDTPSSSRKPREYRVSVVAPTGVEPVLPP